MRTTQHVVNIMAFKKINILEYALEGGGGGHKKEYSLYAFKNVDNCERPLKRTRKQYVKRFICHTNHTETVIGRLKMSIIYASVGQR